MARSLRRRAVRLGDTSRLASEHLQSRVASTIQGGTPMRTAICVASSVHCCYVHLQARLKMRRLDSSTSSRPK